MKSLKDLLNECKGRLPMPELLRAIGLPQAAKRSAKNPWRQDKRASAGIYAKNGAWYFHDFATGEHCDELAVIQKHFEVRGFKESVFKYCDLAGVSRFGCSRGLSRQMLVLPRSRPARPVEVPCAQERFPDLSGFTSGTHAQLAALASSRQISLEGVVLAAQRGFLLFGYHEGHEVWGLTDSTKRALEVRRLDRGLFAKGNKCDARPGSKKRPIGILESVPYPKICIVEGGPDFLQCHSLICSERKEDSVAVVAMLGAGLNFREEDLKHFVGKTVRVFPHSDTEGHRGGARWVTALRNVCARVDFCLFSKSPLKDGEVASDLLDFSLRHHGDICLLP